MNETVAHIYELARALWRRHRLALWVAWLTAVALWAIVMSLPDHYEAQARVFVDARTALRPVLEGISIDEDYASQLNQVREALLSRPQLEAVARQTNLDANVKNAAQMDALVGALQKQIQVVSVRAGEKQEKVSDTIYTITYQNPSRDMSVKVVRTLLDNFTEGTLSGSRSGSDQAQAFLNQQIADLEKRLQESEERLAGFKKRNVGMIPGERGDYFSRMDKEMNDLQQAESNLAVALSRRSELQHQLDTSRAYIPGTAALSNPVAMASAPPDVTVRRQEAEQKLEELLLRYTEKHPEVIALRRTIDELKLREAAELADLQKGGMGTGAIRSLSVNPVYQQIQSQLNQSRVEIASLQGSVNQHRSEIANLRKFVDQAPEIEQEFSRLNRDYGVTKAQYDQLVARREQAKVSDDAARTGNFNFAEIEPPRAGAEPVWPKRGLLVIAGLIAALAAGAAVALLPYLFAPTFDNTATLERKMRLQAIGSVSEIKNEPERAQELLDMRLASISLAVLVALGSLLALVGPMSITFLRNLST